MGHALAGVDTRCALCSNEIGHYISKALTQRVERTNGTLRQQTGGWHRRQNKFGKLWNQTKVSLRLVISYFNWLWQHSCLGTTAASASRVNRSSLDLELTKLPIPHFCRAWPNTRPCDRLRSAVAPKQLIPIRIVLPFTWKLPQHTQTNHFDF